MPEATNNHEDFAKLIFIPWPNFSSFSFAFILPVANYWALFCPSPCIEASTGFPDIAEKIPPAEKTKPKM